MKQTPKKKSNKSLEFAVAASALVCIIAVIAMVVVLFRPKVEKLPFSPPAFDGFAIEGTPDVSQELEYARVDFKDMPFTAFVCNNVQFSGNSADIYFTNPTSNEVWMKLRCYDDKGNIIGETGVILPGEYIKTLIFDIVPESGSEIRFKIMTYEPRTYISAGSAELLTTIKQKP